MVFHTIEMPLSSDSSVNSTVLMQPAGVDKTQNTVYGRN